MSLAAAENVISKAIQRGAKAANAREHRGVRNKLKTVAGMKNPSRKKPAQGGKPRKKKATAAAGDGRLRVTRGMAPVARGYSISGASNRRSVADTGRLETVFSVSSPITPGIWSMLRTDLINPANTELFPRASQIAGTFEKWRLLEFKVEYLPLAPSTNNGLVGMYIDMDATDPATTNLTSTLENRSKDAGNVWMPRSLQMSMSDIRRWDSTDPAQTPTSPAAAIDRQNSPGVLRIFCDKCPGNQALGMIKITSRFQFTDSKPPAALLLYAQIGSPSPTVTITATGTYYIAYPIDIQHAHGFSIIGGRALYRATPGVDDNDDRVDDLQSGGVAANNSAASGYTFALSTAASTMSGSLTIGAAGKAQHALFYVKPDLTIGDLWLGNQSADGVTTAPASSPADTAIFTMPADATRLHYGVKLLVVSGASGGTATYSCAGTNTLAISRRSALPGYGALQARCRVGPPASRSGVLPDADLDSWLAAHAGDEYSLTVYPPSTMSQDEKDQEFLRRLREYGPLLTDDWQALPRRVCAEPPSPTPSQARARPPLMRAKG
jgi:hypothetical protein